MYSSPTYEGIVRQVGFFIRKATSLGEGNE